MEEKQIELIKTEQTLSNQQEQQHKNPYALVEMAIEKNFDLDKLEKVIALQKEYEERQAEKEFEFNFAKMQKDYVPAFKTKKGYTGKYSPLDIIQSVYMPILTKHGFSIRWQQRNIKEENSIEVTTYLSGYGFSRKSSIVLPYAETNKSLNEIQARGSTVSYGRRYTFIDVTGCIIADEDNDAVLPEQDPNKLVKEIEVEISLVPEKMRPALRDELADTKNEDLQNLYLKVWNICESCKNLKLRAKKVSEEKRQEVISKLSKITSLDQLYNLEVSYADLPKLDTGK